MKRRKHTIGKIRRGFYNYRGYCIKSLERGWVVRDSDDERDTWCEPTLRAMRRTIDKYERANF